MLSLGNLRFPRLTGVRPIPDKEKASRLQAVGYLLLAWALFIANSHFTTLSHK